MKRRSALLLPAGLLLPRHARSADIGLLLSGVSRSGFVGPGDIVANATAWFGLWAYNAAYATGSNNALTIRRASDNTTSDIVVLANGTLDIATANTFATVDATASATAVASTTIALTGASSTPHVGSTLTGSGVTQPCYIISVGSFVAGAGNITVNVAQTLSAVSISMQYGMYISKAYDQTANGNHVLQATLNQQPQLMPTGINGLPAVRFQDGAFPTFLDSAATSVSASATANTLVAVAARTANFTTLQIILGWDGADAMGIGWPAVANQGMLSTIVGANKVTGAMTDNVAHSLIGVQTGGTSGIVVIDGVASSPGTIAGAAVSTKISWGRQVSYGMYSDALSGEAGLWAGVTFTPTQYGNMHANEAARWGTP